MKLIETTMMTAALMAVPSFAFAQFSVGSLSDVAKDKAVETVLDNATSSDGITAGTTLLKGGSREDAAIAVVRGRADDRVEGLTGGVSTSELSKNGIVDSGTSIASDRLGNSPTTNIVTPNIVPKSSSNTLTDQASGVIGKPDTKDLPKLGKFGF